MTTRNACSPWLDRFTHPSLEALLTSLPEEARPQVETLRDRMRAIPGVREQVEWLGLPWRWAIAYTHAAHPVSRAVAYMIPDPESVRISIPLDQEFLALIAGPKVSRTLRDSIVQASRVGQIVWPEWTLGSPAHAEELAGVVEAKLTHMQAQVQAELGNTAVPATSKADIKVSPQPSTKSERPKPIEVISKRSKANKAAPEGQAGHHGTGEALAASTAVV